MRRPLVSAARMLPTDVAWKLTSRGTKRSSTAARKRGQCGNHPEGGMPAEAIGEPGAERHAHDLRQRYAAEDPRQCTAALLRRCDGHRDACRHGRVECRAKRHEHARGGEERQGPCNRRQDGAEAEQRQRARQHRAAWQVACDRRADGRQHGIGQRVGGEDERGIGLGDVQVLGNRRDHADDHEGAHADDKVSECQKIEKERRLRLNLSQGVRRPVRRWRSRRRGSTSWRERNAARIPPPGAGATGSCPVAPPRGIAE